MVSRPLTVELDKFVSVLCIKYYLSFTLIVDAIGFKLYKEIIFIFGGCCSFAGGGCSSGRTYGRRGNVVFGATTMLIIYTRIYFIKKNSILQRGSRPVPIDGWFDFQSSF